MPDDTVEINIEGDKIAIKCCKSRFKMAGKAAELRKRLAKWRGEVGAKGAG